MSITRRADCSTLYFLLRCRQCTIETHFVIGMRQCNDVVIDCDMFTKISLLPRIAKYIIFVGIHSSSALYSNQTNESGTIIRLFVYRFDCDLRRMLAFSFRVHIRSPTRFSIHVVATPKIDMQSSSQQIVYHLRLNQCTVATPCSVYTW